MLDVVLLIVGLALTLVGSNALVDGASGLARRFGVSELIIGLTIVAFGTSSPELVVNLMAAFKGTPDLAIGNILGSNIFNIFVILGIAALFYPISIRHSTIWKEIPLGILSMLVLIVIANDRLIDAASTNVISRGDGIVLLLFFAIFMAYIYSSMKRDKAIANYDSGKTVSVVPLWRSILFTVGGLVGLYLGGRWLVSGAIGLATTFGVSDAIIGLTIVAAGTSVPELATSVTAAIKRKTDIAIGNVVGSNLFNVFLVLGTTATIRPLPYSEVMNIDMGMATLGSILLFFLVFMRRGRRVDRIEGGVLVVLYLCYLGFMLSQL